MVQRGYSLALDDQDVLPPWKELPLCSSIVRDVFDNGHVKEWIYESVGAYLHRPTTMSLWSLSLLMECPQDHFTFDALGGQGGGENDGVVYGFIYYCGMFFLTWISKHKKEDLHAAHGSFLFMGVCKTTMENLFMDPCIIFISAHGKNIIFASMDYLTKHLDTLTIQFSALLHKRASFSLSSMVNNGPNCMMETTIFYMALGKCFLSCMFS